MIADRQTRRDRFFVLRRQPLGEQDDIVLGFGLESGRFSAIARGSRRGKSRLAGLLEPPVELEASLRQGSSLDSLSQVQLCRAFASMRQNLDALLCAGFLARLFAEALPERSPLPEAYRLYSDLHERLANQEGVATVALWGQDRLLAELGLEVAIGGCLGCGSPRALRYDPEEGGLLCGDCQQGAGWTVSPGALDALRALRDCPLHRRLPPVAPPEVRELGRILKGQMQHHLGLPNRLFRPVLPRRKQS